MKIIFKKYFRKIARKYFSFFANKVLKNNNAKIFVITGSCGKTTSRYFLIPVLEKKYKKVLTNIENYNTDFGIILSIFNKKMPKSNIGFFWILLSLKVIFFYRLIKFDACVFETAVDKVGDMDDILKIFHGVEINYGIFTNISPNHLDGFGNVEKIFTEKKKIIKKSNIKIINIDDDILKNFACENKNTFSCKNTNSDIYARNLFCGIDGIKGDIFLSKEQKFAEIKLNIFSKSNFYSVLVAVFCGILENIKSIEILEAIKNSQMPKSRSDILRGKKNTIIIDSSYNSSPKTCIEMIKNLGKINTNRRKILILGQMLELGKESIKYHKKLGNFAEKNADVIFSVGPNDAKYLCKNKNMYYENVEKLKMKIIKMINKDDIIFIKGSNNINLKEIVNILVTTH